MRIYISGKISGLPIEEAKQRFADSQALLESIGFEVVNPLEVGLCDEKASWESHMVKDIELLLGCDAIYMMDNWVDSTGASIEYDIAIRMGKDVLFESNVVRNSLFVLKIQNAIHDVTGLKFNEYTTMSRQRDDFFARMLFAYHCRRLKMKVTDIANYVNRTHAAALHMLKKYDDEVKYNPNFRDLATKVNDILNR